MKYLLICLTMFFSVIVTANPLYCGGKLNGVFVSKVGDVVIQGDWINEWTKICNLTSDPSVDSVTCSLWAAYAANAFQNKTNVLLVYPEGVSQCSTIPLYSASPTPSYFMITK